MATLFGNTVWEGTSLDKPTLAQGAKDGHFLKELDTGESYIMVNGEWEFINLGLSYIKATKSGEVTTDANGFAHITFATPFINNQYSVHMACADMGAIKPPLAFVSNKTVNGFDIQTRDSKQGVPYGNVPVSCLATRHYNP